MRSIVCLLLYGSRARGDHDAHSDIDLAAITSNNTPERVTIGRTATMADPLDHVLRVARSGGLFAYHIVSEAKVVFETEPVFERIQQAFRFRDDYTPVIRMCSEAGWFLLRHHERAVNARKFNQAMAWCTREMLIARAATERLPDLLGRRPRRVRRVPRRRLGHPQQAKCRHRACDYAVVPGHTPRIWCDRADTAAPFRLRGAMFPCSPKFCRGDRGPRVSQRRHQRSRRRQDSCHSLMISSISTSG